MKLDVTDEASNRTPVVDSGCVVMLQLRQRQFALHDGRGRQSSKLFVYASGSNNDISVFQVNTNDGTLPAIAGSPFPAMATMPGRAATDASSKVLFVTNQSSNGLSVYLINPGSAALSPAGTGLTGSLPQDVAVDPAANFVYVLTADQLIAYSFDPLSGAVNE